MGYVITKIKTEPSENLVILHDTQHFLISSPPRTLLSPCGMHLMLAVDPNLNTFSNSIDIHSHREEHR